MNQEKSQKSSTKDILSKAKLTEEEKESASKLHDELVENLNKNESSY
jgi:hypothetical protein